MRVDQSISDAVDKWLSNGINPGSCTELLLRGDYDEAFLHAHPLIKPFWKEHIRYIESIPAECRGENYDTWKGLQHYWEGVDEKEK